MNRLKIVLAALLAALVSVSAATPAMTKQYYNPDTNMWEERVVSPHGHGNYTPIPREVGVLFVATADTQDMANQIAKACNPYFFHYPAVMDKELPSYGFAFTPADIPRGRVYEFKLNHVVALDDPLELVRTVWLDLAESGHAELREVANG